MLSFASISNAEKLLEDNVKEAEIKKIAKFFAEHNVALQVTDYLVPLLKDIYRDSKVAESMKMKRIPSAHRLLRI